MHTPSFSLFLAISSYFHLVQSFAIPQNHHGGSIERLTEPAHHPNLDNTNALLGIRANPKSAKPPQKAQPSNPTKPGATPPASKPSPSSLSASAVKPLPFAKEPRPTTAYNVCDLPGFDCGSEAEDFVEVLDKREAESDELPKAALEKRSSPRTYSVAPGGGTPTMMMTSLPYPLEAKSFPAGAPKVILDYSTDNVRDASFKKSTVAPHRTRPSTYIVEHIVELQSIMLFLKGAIRDKKARVDPQVQKKIAARPRPFTGSSPNTALSSLNDLIFEAIGSKSNTADFVLCEEGVNSTKAKLWSQISPFELTRWQEIALAAADGSIPSNRHLAAMRSILGVYNYLNDPDVTMRMRDTVKNVKTEFSNFEFITGEDVKNIKGSPVSLQTLWIEFMNQQLVDFTTRGVNWLKDHTDYALPKYKSHLADLDTAMKCITEEEAIKDITKRQAAINQRTEESNKLIKALPNDRTIWNQAETRLETAKKALNAANAALKNPLPAAKSGLLADRQAKLQAKQAAEKAYLQALITKGKRERDIIKLRKVELAALIKDVEADIKQLTDYRAAASAIKAPKAE